MSFPYTNQHLVAAGVSPGLWVRYLAPLNAAAIEFDITTGERPAMFLAQVAHESENFRYVTEIWGPTAQQKKYDDGGPLAISLGNGPGDGPRYPGDGLIEITGKTNHQACASYFGIELAAVRLWLQTAVGACRSAGWFWHTHGCNAFADNFDIVGCTKRINGGENGLQQRTDLYKAISAV